MPATTKKPIKIVPNTIKTIPKVPLSPISKSKSFQEKLNDIQNNIDINIDDIPEDLLDIWDELQEDITPKLISKNYKLWLTIFTPFILPGIINGMSGKPAVPQPVVTVQEPAPDPKQIVNFAQKYFAEHGLELCKSLTKTDLNSMKQDLINNWGKGPDAFSKTFQDSYPVSKSRLENIYRSERHLAEYNGVLERAKIADHKYKQWRAVGDERSCDLCMSHDMETVPINEPFSNGEMTATGHPQCRCSMVTYSDEDYNEMKEDSAYLDDVVNTIKLNYNCPDDEKIGSGPGSCSGGNTSNLDKVSTLKNKIRELEKSVSEGKSTFDEAYEQYKSIQKELDLELEKEKLRNPDNAKITNDIVTDPEPITPYKALSDYQNYAYTAINDYLRKTNHVKQNPQQTKNIQNMIKTIDSEMENNPLKSDKLVFRADSAGISSDAFEKTGLTNIFKDTFGKESLTLEDFIKNHKLIDKIREKLVGYEYTEKAYLSTGSDKENTMNRFLAPSRDISKYGVTGLINLIVPKGTPAIRIADYTGLEDELGGKIDEYLIGRDQTIVIDQVYIRPADDDRLYLEYNAHIKTNEQKQNSAYLADATNFIKLNYNCPDSEKIGSGPGSCSGGKTVTEQQKFSTPDGHNIFVVIPLKDGMRELIVDRSISGAKERINILNKILSNGDVVVNAKYISDMANGIGKIPDGYAALRTSDGNYIITNKSNIKESLSSNVITSIENIDLYQIRSFSAKETKINATDSQQKTLKKSEKLAFKDLSNSKIKLARMYTYANTYKAIESYNLDIPQKKGLENAGRKITKILDTLIDKTVIEPGTMLWKGLNFNNVKLPEACLQEGSEFSYKNFNSFTASLSVASDYSTLGKDWDANADKYAADPAIIEVRFPKGGKGLLLTGKHSGNERGRDKDVVNEVVLPRNQKFKVISNKKTPFGTKIIWEAI